MTLSLIDWSIIIAFFVISLAIGVIVMKSAGKSAKDFFLSGRSMPWWLLGVSMVATTFAADTPNLVTQLVRENGVMGNWLWWSYLLTGMLTVFFYARLWRRSGVTTDLEFYEIRYSGPLAAFLRGFRAIYLGVIFNVIIMAVVSLAAIKIGEILLGFSPLQTILIASIVTIIYSTLGGLKGILFTDFFQFIIAMAGSIGSCYYILQMPEVGGLDNLLTHPNVTSHLRLIPDFGESETFITIMIIPLAVQWWSTWYPGSEPGGGGYIAQRMLSAKNEEHATGATLFFNLAHYALRPWPWILIGLASLIIFPTVESIGTAFPNIDPDSITHDYAYPAMLTYLPVGLLGIVVASLIAAYMSTISTHLNWGSSYMVNDVYKRFIHPEASEKQQVVIGRLSTVILMVLAAFLALLLTDAKQGFMIILSIGAGTGLIFILRWFWRRINPISEIVGMLVSFLVALYFKFFEHNFSDTQVLLISLAITTAAWIIATLLTPTTDTKTWNSFKHKVFSQGYKKALKYSVVGFFAGTIGIFSGLFGVGYFIYGWMTEAIIATVTFIVCAVVIVKIWKGMHLHRPTDIQMEEETDEDLLDQ